MLTTYRHMKHICKSVTYRSPITNATINRYGFNSQHIGDLVNFSRHYISPLQSAGVPSLELNTNAFEEKADITAQCPYCQ